MLGQGCVREHIMADNTLSLHLSDDTKKRLDQLSQTTNRSPTSITSEALVAYLNQQEWQIEAIDDRHPSCGRW
jgi:predicted transcriptional regulator